jgi:hypothetical protein
MKKNAIPAILLCMIFLIPFTGFSQRSEWVNQVLIGDGGKFESSPPFSDYVRMQTYDPSTHVASFFNTIYTQSVQDILISGNYAFVAAQDSIVKYDINTHQRVAAVADSGVCRLGIYNDRLIVSKQYPIVRFFVEVLNANSLALIDLTQNISGDCGEVYCSKDSVYVAVNGGFLGSVGKLAVINPSNWDLAREINFGAAAIGIFDLYYYYPNIYTINRTPFGGGNIGSITSYNIYNCNFTNTILPYDLGEGIGTIDSVLYVKISDGVGSFNLKTKTIIDPVIIPDPGSQNHIYITSGATDYVNNYLYLNIGDELSWGINVTTTTLGDSLTSFATGISADAMALDYRVPVGIDQPKPASASVAMYPNPVTESVRIQYFGQGTVTEYIVMDLTGRTVARSAWNSTGDVAVIDCANYPSGLYFLTLKTDRETLTRKFIKN